MLCRHSASRDQVGRYHGLPAAPQKVLRNYWKLIFVPFRDPDVFGERVHAEPVCLGSLPVALACRLVERLPYPEGSFPCTDPYIKGPKIQFFNNSSPIFWAAGRLC